ncbi:unnamed protein product [Orchesella dallaii]|uniref:Reelin domain-containing protein n=1 Tax=Orchesella dallaii TaxID=48710 RepID=A0ABP1RYP8_9HEXA
MDLPSFPSHTPRPTEKDLLRKLSRGDGFCSKAAGLNRAKLAPFCTNMVPNHKPKFEPQPASTCPWKFYLNRGDISESFSHPVIIGAVEGGSERLRNFMITAKQVEQDGSLGRIVGHWEYQWDTIPICCYEPGKDYSHEGRQLHPNLLIGRQANPRGLNQTLIWTAPHHFEGSVVIVATFWKTSRLYWPYIESVPIIITRKSHHPNFSQG